MSNITIVNAGTIPYGVTVREEGQLETFSATVDEFENVSSRSRLSFSWSLIPKASAGLDTIMAIRNESDSLFLHIVSVEMTNDADTMVQIHLTNGAAYTAAGLAIVGVCWNDSAPRVANVTAFGDETANVQGRIIWQHEILADIPRIVDLHGAVILSKGETIAVDYTAAAGALATMTILGYFEVPAESRN